ncbi:MAG: ABC-type transport auxiliary lipoprotein family protein [Dokdonella sp.]
MNFFFRIAFSALALLVGGGCSLLASKSEPYAIYSPQLTVPTETSDAAPVAWQLVVDTPTASDALDTTRIVVMAAPGVLQVYPAARWSDPAPRLLRNLMIQSFQQTGRIAGVGDSGSGLRADYALATDLHEFQIDFSKGAPQAVIRLNAKLLDYAVNRVVTAQSFDATVPAGGTDGSAAATALQAALNDALPKITQWVLQEAEKNFVASKRTAAKGDSTRSDPTSRMPPTTER